MRPLRLLAALLPLALLLAAGSAQAQAWPAAKPITLIVPYAAGGSVDFIARMIATRLGDRLKQSIVVENISGAGGAIGVAKAAAAAPDGYTLVAAPDSTISIGKLINPSAYRFDPLQDLAPVGMLYTAPLVLVARPGLGVKNYADFVKLAKASPGKYNYATSGVGTVLHLAMEMLKQRSGIYVTHIPYRGAAQIATDVMGDQVDTAMLINAGSMQGYIKSGKLQALGITGSKRLETLPAVPTFDEMPGLKGYTMVAWTGIFAPAHTPAPIVAQLNQEMNAVLNEPDIRAKLLDQGALPGSGSADELGRFAHSEFARNQKLVQGISFKE